jgi:ribokinase
MKTEPRIVVIGSLVMDFVAKGERLPSKGETVLGESFGVFPGGKGANQAVQAGRLGAEVFMIGCVGADVFGEELLTSLKQSRVNTQFVRKERSAKTAACCIHVDAQGNNSIIIVPQANLTCSTDQVDAAADVIKSADVLVCQLEIPVATVEYALRLAASQGVRTMLNPAPAQLLSKTVYSGVTVLTPNETEAQILLPGPGVSGQDLTATCESRMARTLLAEGPKIVILTLGERGAYIATEQTERLIPAFPVQVKDATAAGDAFNGALAMALGEGRELEDAVVFANAAGALATTRDGAQPSLAWREEIDTFLKVNKPR